MLDNLAMELSSRKFKFLRNYSPKNQTAIKSGGVADIFAIPSSAEEYICLIKYLNSYGVPRVVVGGMSNTLLASDLYEGVIICTRGVNQIGFANDTAFAECGASLASVMSAAHRMGLGGSEALWLIPGTVGGALRGNAGAHGREISDIVESADVHLPDGRVRRISAKDMALGYRDSIFKLDHGIDILSVRLKLDRVSAHDALDRRKFFLRERRLSQPTNLPSLGSVFKRYNGVGAGYYVERAGLKGFSVGDAAVSEKHAGFVVNLGNARWQDILNVVETVERDVFLKFGITLEREIETIS